MAIVWIILTQAVLAYLCTGILVNVALNKPASMSSTYSNRNGAANAVDGTTTAVSPSIIHTDVGKPFAWWMVDIQTQVQDATVKIYFRTDYKARRNGVKLYTSTNNIPYPPSGGTPCHTFTNPVPDIDSINCTGSWRYLMIHTTTRYDGHSILDFGEVQVIVCSAGTYGNNCTKSCSSRQCSVSSTSCPRYTGACPGGCQAGWMETDCTQACSSEKYGPNCSQLCNSRQCMETSGSCNRSTGACPGGCLSGWRGTDCTQECTSGSYGPGCTMPCNSRKCTEPSSCDLVTGQCDRGCLPGWNGTDCTKQCSGGTYGDSCGQLCESRHCLVQSDTCNHVTGACSVDGCMSGWNGTDCTLACTLGTYGSNCLKSCSDRQCRTLSSSCNRETGQCPDGCQDGWSGVDCTTDDVCPDTDVDKLTAGVIGAVIGVIVSIAVGAMVHICLVRHGRIEWKKSEGTRQSVEMSDLSNHHENSRTAAENPQSNTANLYNHDYSVLDSTTKSETRVYDVLHDKDKDYQNV